MEVRLNRIAGNALMLWGRSLVAAALGLFASRWVLMSLGADLLGLYGALMGLLAFAGLLGGVLQLSMVRSMSIAVGADGGGGLSATLRASLVLAAIFALLLAAVALPAGEAYVRCRMEMAPQFRGAAVWVWRLAVAGSSLAAFALPYTSLLAARQRFGVLSAMGLVQSFGCFALAAAMVFGLGGLPAEGRLVVFGAANMALSVAVAGIALLASRGLGAERDGERRGGTRRVALDIVRFAACELWSGLGDVVRRNGITLYLNNAFGGAVTAAWGIGHSVNNHATSLSSAVGSAFMPAAMKGGGDGARIAMASARWGFLTTAVFAVPFCFASEWVLRLWLGEPPEGAAFFASALLAATTLQRLGGAQHLIVMERGRVALYHAVVGTTSMLTLPLAVALCRVYGFAGAGWAFVAGFAAIAAERVVLGRIVAGVRIAAWVRAVLLPCAAATAVLAAVCWCARCALVRFAFDGLGG